MIGPTVEAPSRLLTPGEVCTQLAVTLPTLRTWRSHGLGPKAIKVGKHLRWRQADIDAWLDAHQEK